MSAAFESVVTEIEKAAEILRRDRPFYESLLDFYAGVFIAQEKARRHLELKPSAQSKELVSLKLREGFPLAGPGEFRIDENNSEALLKTLCRMAMQSNEKLKDAAEKLVRAVKSHMISPPLLFQAFLSADDSYLDTVAGNLSIEQRVLAFFIYNSVKPSLVAGAEHLATLLPPDRSMNDACPVCGGQPAMAVLEDEGRRCVFCSFCGHKRRVPRLYCAFCGNDAQKSLGYFYSAEEPEYRVDTCERCKSYLKTVDKRQLNRPFYPPIEQVCTQHLDMRAQEAGYHSPVLDAKEAL